MSVAGKTTKAEIRFTARDRSIRPEVEDLAKRAARFAASGDRLMRTGLTKHAFRSAQVAYRYAATLAGDAARIAPKKYGTLHRREDAA